MEEFSLLTNFRRDTTKKKIKLTKTFYVVFKFRQKAKAKKIKRNNN